MGSLDSVTWQVLTLSLTVVGAITTFLLWRSRGATSGVRALAWTLLPAVAYLTGTLRLGWEVVDALVSWAVRFTFSPFVWMGLALAGASAALFVLSGVMRRRGVGTRGVADPDPGRAALDAQTSRRPARPAKPEKQPKRGAGPVDEEVDDIEAILKRHGIS